MFEPGQRVGVAVSGGADSVCLLHALIELGGLRLTVLHVDHRLRGEESRGDAEFVRELAARFGLPFCLREIDLPPGNLEQEARKARLSFFHEQLAESRADRVALGHTRSDQAETVLFRLLRGSGTAGLSGIRPVTAEGLVRPLIELERGEIERYLRERGISWREDSTNAAGEFARNRIRRELLPQLATEWNPGIVETLAQTAEIAQGEEEYWKDEVDRLAAQHLGAGSGGVLVKAGVFGELPLAAARRLVRRAIETAKGDLRGVDFRHVERVLEMAAADGPGRLQIPGLDVRRSFEWIRLGIPILRKPYSLIPVVPGITPIPGTGMGISLELIEKSETSALTENVYNIGMGCLDWERLAGSLELRNWRFGDRYQPMGISGTEKIKTLFQLQRIPVWERAEWPVLTDGMSIVWTRGFGPAAAYAAGPESSTRLKVGEVSIR
ncbi:MAG: tRNA(Ile)-lysidine synthetase [Candidatus Solibacter sp.]|nr:tRNA(Ile)-lysidine synthetase [Candidatus Solibacter sp.]